MKDLYTKKWIIENSIEICKRYEKKILTIRGLHYQLVGLGMINDVNHYCRVVNAMTCARWKGLIDFDQFSDRDREMLSETEYKSISLEDKIVQAKQQIGAWMNNYSRNRWENQYYFPEVIIEKKALLSLLEPICKQWNIGLGAGKGYSSLTFLDEMADRMIEAEETGAIPIMIYFGDHDPSGDDVPRSIIENLQKLGVQNVELMRVALTKEQVIEMKLPVAIKKAGDTRSAKWTGLGQVELDAIEPLKLQEMCENAIQNVFDQNVYDDLMLQEAEETIVFRETLKKYVQTL